MISFLYRLEHELRHFLANVRICHDEHEFFLVRVKIEIWLQCQHKSNNVFRPVPYKLCLIRNCVFIFYAAWCTKKADLLKSSCLGTNKQHFHEVICSPVVNSFPIFTSRFFRQVILMVPSTLLFGVQLQVVYKT